MTIIIDQNNWSPELIASFNSLKARVQAPDFREPKFSQEAEGAWSDSSFIQESQGPVEAELRKMCVLLAISNGESEVTKDVILWMISNMGPFLAAMWKTE